MTHSRLKFKFWSAVFFALFLHGAHAQLTADKLLVVYNVNVPESIALAEDYAALRGVPKERLFGVVCDPKRETISHAQFKSQMQEPITRYCRDKGWFFPVPSTRSLNGREWNLLVSENSRVFGLVLAWGLPLRIEHDPARVDASVDHRFQTNASAVDSELATLPAWGQPVSAAIPNAYFGSKFRFSEHDAKLMLIVARLDGPTAGMARQRLHEAVETEKVGLRGKACFDTRGIGSGVYADGDEWIKKSAELTRERGITTLLDAEEAVVGENPEWNDIALYAGWYSTDLAGVFATPKFHFNRGAVAYHIHSFSAETLRSVTKYWCGPMIARGAVATMGCVFEPFLQLTPQVDIFYDRLLKGWTFGEAAYASQKWLSWMITIVGDPLYNPFSDGGNTLQPTAGTTGNLSLKQ